MEIHKEKDFWDRVRYLLKKNRIKQETAALSCGVKLRTFRSWIQKEYYPSVLGGHNLARLLGVTVEFLITGRDSETKNQIENIRGLLKEADEKLRILRK